MCTPFFFSSEPATLRPRQHLKLKFDVMLHQANANFPATDIVSNRAPNAQPASEVQLYRSAGFKRQNTKPQTNRNIKQERST